MLLPWNAYKIVCCSGGGLGRFDFGFGFGFGGHCEQYVHKSCCIIPANCLFWSRGGWGGSTSGSGSASVVQYMHKSGCRRAVEQRPRIAAARGVSDTVSHWRTRTARNHMPAGPGYQRGFVFYGQVSWDNSMLPEGVGLLWTSHRGKRSEEDKKDVCGSYR